MSGGITLDKEFGVNAHLTKCPNCDADTPAIVLLGNKKYKGRCRACGVTSFGITGRSRCLKCKSPDVDRELIQPYERIPWNVPCDLCAAEANFHKQIVEEGGVYFQCKECFKKGVIRSNEWTAEFRRLADIPAPGMCGVEFQKCSQHGTEEEVTR